MSTLIGTPVGSKAVDSHHKVASNQQRMQRLIPDKKNIKNVDFYRVFIVFSHSFRLSNVQKPEFKSGVSN